MPRTLRLIYFLLICSTAIFFVAKPSFGVTPPKTKCNIRVDNPHISNYLLRTLQTKAVKVNARSKCNRLMSNLELTVEIYKVGLFMDHKVASEKVTIQTLVEPNKIVKNEETYAVCKNSKQSKFYGRAFASALIEGKRYQTPKVLTAKTISLDCGT